MSVANIAIGRDRAVIVADEMVYRDADPVGFARKIATNDRANVALTVRGRVVVADGLDGLVEGATDAEDAMQRMRGAVAILTADHLDWAYEAWLIGVDKSTGAAWGHVWWHAPSTGLAPADRALGSGTWLQPGLGRRDVPPDLTDEQHFKIALAQQALSIEANFNECIGGSVHMVEVTRTGIARRCLGDYPDRALAEARVARNQARPGNATREAAA